jgi:hypothetical protein
MSQLTRSTLARREISFSRRDMRNQIKVKFDPHEYHLNTQNTRASLQVIMKIKIYANI